MGLSQTKCVGLLATEATVGRGYIDGLEAEFAVDCKVFRFPCQALVAIAEDKMLNRPLNMTKLQEVIDDMYCQSQGMNIDVLILGCTHFPALKDEIKACWPGTIHLIDSGVAIALRVEYLLDQLVGISPKGDIPTTIYTTAEVEMNEIKSIMKKHGIKKHNVIEVFPIL